MQVLITIPSTISPMGPKRPTSNSSYLENTSPHSFGRGAVCRKPSTPRRALTIVHPLQTSLLEISNLIAIQLRGQSYLVEFLYLSAGVVATKVSCSKPSSTSHMNPQRNAQTTSCCVRYTRCSKLRGKECPQRTFSTLKPAIAQAL